MAGQRCTPPVEALKRNGSRERQVEFNGVVGLWSGINSTRTRVLLAVIGSFRIETPATTDINCKKKKNHNNKINKCKYTHAQTTFIKNDFARNRAFYGKINK